MKIIITYLIFFTSIALAVDNPDAPNLVQDFENRLKIHERKISEKSGGSSAEISLRYHNYENFLDSELNMAYSTLLKKISKKEQEKIKISQNVWLKFRDSEYDFISGNWNLENSGSSYKLSIGNYRAEIIKSRIFQLLSYLRNYR